MSRFRTMIRLSPLVLLAGCAARAGNQERIAADMRAMPAQTVMLSRMMRELSAQPGFTEQLLQQMDKGQKNGAVLTPALFDLFRKLVLGKDWKGLDRFPGWTIEQVTRTVDAGTSLLTKRDAAPGEDVLKVQLGAYALDRADTVSLDAPSELPGFSTDGLIAKLGDEVVRGDGADPRLAPTHAESARLAEVLNRLSLNGFQPSGSRPAVPFVAQICGKRAGSPEGLVAALTATGHTVTVADARYFANFGHFHYKGQDVEMPFWLDSGLLVPPERWWSGRRKLLVPVAHAEYEWIVSGPKVNADVTFYFGIDGRAEFRTNDQLNQAWVMGRHAHEYRGDRAVEVTRLTGRLLRAYAYLHPGLPFGGYYTLGVCQDVVAAIEQRMTGTTTIFPNTARTEMFHDQPDEEVFRLMEAIPKDTAGRAPAPERIFGSLPAVDFSTLTVPGLREDVENTYGAWRDGRRVRSGGVMGRAISFGGLVVGAVLVGYLMRFRRRRSA